MAPVAWPLSKDVNTSFVNFKRALIVENKHLICFMLWPITDMMTDTGNPYYVCLIYTIPIIQSKTIKQSLLANAAQ